MTAASLAACCALAALTSSCSGGSETSSELHNAGGDARAADDRDTGGIDSLLDAAIGGGDSGTLGPGEQRDGGGGDGDGDAMQTMTDAQTPPPNDGGPIEPDAEVTDPYAIAFEPSERGPWPVGVRTVQLAVGGGHAPVEIWYPAIRGSETDKASVAYDFIQWLPPEAVAAIPASEKPVNVPCNCYRDLPIDSAHGPYPIAIFVHNIGTFRVSSVGIMEHWASRGFIVAALDHPRLTLQDVLAFATVGRCTSSRLSDDATRRRDLTALIDALRGGSGEYAFLDGAIDASHIAVSGHVEGAEYASRASGIDGVRLIMQWNNSLTVTKAGDLEAVAYFASSEDSSSAGAYATVENAAIDAPVPALFVGTNNAGMQSMTELCHAQNALGRDGMAIAARYELCGADYNILSIGWDCNTRFLSRESANSIFGFATTAALEQYLKGIDHSASWARFSALWGEARVVGATDGP